MTETREGDADARGTARAPAPDRDLLDELDARMEAGGDPLGALAAILSSAAPARSTLLDLQGTRIQGFELTSILGVGGMGVTYAASDGRDEVAVKVVANLSTRSQERFDAECRILRTLAHPGIVRYRDHGLLPGGTAWLMMDLVQGTGLQSILDELLEERSDRSAAATALLAGAGATADAVGASTAFLGRMARLLAAVADAVHHAHEAGVVHGDVKPANVLVGPDLEPVLIDFGLSLDLFRDVSLTQTAAVMGTLSYMAPEQLLGDAAAIDRRTDVFALGLVLYRALCGTDLRSRSDQVLGYHRRRFLLPAPAARRLPVAIQAILYRCLEPAPGRRYATANELSRDLRAVADGRRPLARRPHALVRHLRSRRGTITKASLAVALAALPVWLLRPQPVLSVDVFGNKATGRLSIDGVATDLHTPLEGYRIAPGGHEIEYRADGLKTVRRVIEIRNPHTRVNLLPIPDSWTPARSLDAGADAAWLAINPSGESNEVFVDERRVDARAGWIAVSPGRHALEARSPGGDVERQVVHLAANELHPVHMLSPEVAGLPGSFRLTLGQVLSPLPEGIALDLQGSAVPFMDEQREPGARPQEIATHCYITPMEPGEWATASLAVTFPRPMARVSFYCHVNLHEGGGEMRLSYRFDEGPWNAIAYQLGSERCRVNDIAAGGARRLELRARMRANQRPVSFATLQFLHGYMDHGGDVETTPACFAVVAEPE